MRGQIIYRKTVAAILAAPGCAALLEPDIAARHFAVAQRHPRFEAELRAGEIDIVLHPLPKPGLNIHIIRLHPDRTAIQQAVVVAQIHSHLHHAMLAGEAGETHLTFGAVAVFPVKPG